MPDETAAGNIPEFSVGELAGAVKRTLETAFGRVRVRGEITELRLYGSGHAYLSLKDEAARLRAVILRSTLPRVGLAPENGVEVIATGRLSTYTERTEVQLVIERLEYAGVGALLARIEALRVRLAGEGLFDAARKRTWPLLPPLVGVVTSPQGAVLQDIRTTIARRFPRPILLWPVPVQGEGSAARIAQAIAGMDSLPSGDVPRPEVLIVARGGGGLEDLMAFNDEAVVRAAAACRLPLISAVGHETDTTLIDHAADRRAPTPTAAAELALPSRVELLADLAQRGARLIGAAGRGAEQRRHRLAAAAGALPDPASLAAQARQRLEDRTARLSLALPALVSRRRAALTAAERLIPDPRHLADRKRATLASAGALLGAGLVARRHAADRAAAGVLGRLQVAGLQAHVGAARERLAGLAARLEGASYEAVLARGFALVRDGRGQPVTRATDVRRRQSLTLRFADGEVAVREDATAQGSLPV